MKFCLQGNTEVLHRTGQNEAATKTKVLAVCGHRYKLFLLRCSIVRSAPRIASLDTTRLFGNSNHV